jgi:hypothetical protein
MNIIEVSNIKIGNESLGYRAPVSLMLIVEAFHEATWTLM